jgi:hypothetical protein
MSLLHRIAGSGGDPERARKALDLIIQKRLCDLGRPSMQPEIDRLFECLEQIDRYSGSTEVRPLILAGLSTRWPKPKIFKKRRYASL